MVWEGQCAAGEAAKVQLRQVQSRLGAEQEHTVELEGELEALLNHVQQVPPLWSFCPFCSCCRFCRWCRVWFCIIQVLSALLLTVHSVWCLLSAAALHCWCALLLLSALLLTVYSCCCCSPLLLLCPAAVPCSCSPLLLSDAAAAAALNCCLMPCVRP